jgi:riboflavin synthase
LFTGLIEELGILQQIIRGADSACLKIKAQSVLEETRPGESIAVNGVCLTVTACGKNFFTADVMSETLAKTNLGQLTPGDRVDLERAARINDRLGGHLVSGHIDGVGIIGRYERHDFATLITVNAPLEFMRYIIKKGSVAIDGISLTVVDFDRQSFQVSLIPHTARLTTLGYKGPGEMVNLEADLIGKYVERFLLERQNNLERKGVSFEFLAAQGFI